MDFLTAMLCGLDLTGSFNGAGTLGFVRCPL